MLSCLVSFRFMSIVFSPMGRTIDSREQGGYDTPDRKSRPSTFPTYTFFPFQESRRRGNAADAPPSSFLCFHTCVTSGPPKYIHSWLLPLLPLTAACCFDSPLSVSEIFESLILHPRFTEDMIVTLSVWIVAWLHIHLASSSSFSFVFPNTACYGYKGIGPLSSSPPLPPFRLSLRRPVSSSSARLCLPSSLPRCLAASSPSLCSLSVSPEIGDKPANVLQWKAVERSRFSPSLGGSSAGLERLECHPSAISYQLVLSLIGSRPPLREAEEGETGSLPHPCRCSQSLSFHDTAPCSLIERLRKSSYSGYHHLEISPHKSGILLLSTWLALSTPQSLSLYFQIWSSTGLFSVILCTAVFRR